MKILKKWVAHNVLENIYIMYVRPNFDYGDIVYHKPNDCASPSDENLDPLMNQIEQLQYEAARVIT